MTKKSKLSILVTGHPDTVAEIFDYLPPELIEKHRYIDRGIDAPALTLSMIADMSKATKKSES